MQNTQNTKELRCLEGLSCEELRERLRAMYRLLNVTSALAHEIDLDRILDTIAHNACQALNCDRASLFQYDAERQELFTRVATQLEIDEIRHGIDQGVTGYVARTLEVVNIPATNDDVRWNSRVDLLTGYTTRNLLAAPIVLPHDGSLFGVLQVLNKLSGTFDAFDEEMIQAFCQHAAVAIDRSRMVQELRAREEIAASLSVARQVQQSFMPRELPAVPGYSLAHWWLPNQAVGGDYCDVLPMPGGDVGLVMADVSGHGLGPALIMATVRATLRALLPDHTEPHELLSALNRTMLPDFHDGRFVTMVIAELSPRNHRVRFANAGHGPALHYCAASDTFCDLESQGLPLGVRADLGFDARDDSSVIHMRPGDVLFLCTDGIVEAVNADHIPFGVARLKNFIREHRGHGVQTLVAELAHAIQQHFVGDDPEDDLTVLAVQRE